ncbi:MAG: septal ring lytic transglycosylase RlpA family protein [Nonlabens sp.]
MSKKFLALLLASIFSILSFAQVQTGKASFYADKFEGRQTASGVKYRHNKPTAAHRTLPFGTKLRVTNLANNRSQIVTVNDRGPFVRGRIIDVSKSIAQKLDFVGQGVTDVVIEVVGDSQTPVENVDPDQMGDTAEDIAAYEQTPAEFYNINIERADPTGFGVQIGSFQELANLIRLTDNLEKSYDSKVTAQVKTVQGIKVYTLIIGNFKEREKAERFRKKVARRYPGAFIVEYAKFENVTGK